MESDETILRELKRAVVTYDDERVKEVAHRVLARGIDPLKALEEGLAEGVREIGERFEKGEAFLPHLMVAAKAMKEGLSILEPEIRRRGHEVKTKGTVVIGTIEGDLHDIGKNIFNTLVTIAGFEVVDLGIDVSAEKIVDAVRKHKPNILGLSALLTTNLEQFPIVIEMLKRQGLRDKIKVIVGGATVTEDFAREAGVDAYTKTAVEGVEICKQENHRAG